MTMKFRAHDTFFIRKGWLSKGMKYVHIKPDIFVDKTENPMDVLGIGSNMVKALRYWLQTVGLTQEPTSGRRIQSFTDFAFLALRYFVIKSRVLPESIISSTMRISLPSTDWEISF